MDVVSSVVPSSSCVQMSQVFAVIFPTSSWLIKTQKFISSFQTWWWWDSPSVTLFIVICGGGGDLRMDMWGAPVVVSTLCPRQQVKNCNMNTREAKVDDDGQIISFYTSLRWSGSTKTCQDPRFYSMPFFYFFFSSPTTKLCLCVLSAAVGGYFCCLLMLLLAAGGWNDEKSVCKERKTIAVACGLGAGGTTQGVDDITMTKLILFSSFQTGAIIYPQLSWVDQGVGVVIVVASLLVTQ